MAQSQASLGKLMLVVALLSLAIAMNTFQFVFLPWLQSDHSPKLWTENTETEKIVEGGMYTLPKGLTLERIQREQDPQHPDQIVFRFLTRPLHRGERPVTVVIYIKDGTP